MAVILETSLGQLTVDLYTTERPRCEPAWAWTWLPTCHAKWRSQRGKVAVSWLKILVANLNPNPNPTILSHESAT